MSGESYIIPNLLTFVNTPNHRENANHSNIQPADNLNTQDQFFGDELSLGFVDNLHNNINSILQQFQTDPTTTYNIELKHRARNIIAGLCLTELGGNYYSTYRYDSDTNGLYIRNGNGPYIYNTGTDRNGRYIGGHEINTDGTVTNTYMLPSSQVPDVSNLSRQDAIRHLNLIENKDGTFRREGFVGTYKVRDDGTVFFGGGYHSNCGNQIDLPPQTYINGGWYSGNVRPGSTPFDDIDDKNEFFHYHYEFYMQGHFFWYQFCPPEPAHGIGPIVAANRSGVVYGDPIFESNGGRFEVRGEAHRIYNLLSDRDIQINARFLPSGTVETNLGDFGIRIRNHRIEFRDEGRAFINGIELHRGAEVTLENEETLTWDSGNLTINTGEYNIRIKRNRIEIRTGELGVFQDGVMPHGLFGQTIDLEGRPRNSRGIQGEGAIEGTYRDYEVTNLFSNNFRFNRNIHNTGANNNRVIIRYNPRMLFENEINHNPFSSALLRRDEDFWNRLDRIFRNSTLNIFHSANIQVSVTGRNNLFPRTSLIYIRTRNNIIEYRTSSRILINGNRLVTRGGIALYRQEIVNTNGDVLTIRADRYTIRIAPDVIEIEISSLRTFENPRMPYALPRN